MRTMLAEIGRGDFSAALKIYRRSVPLPGIISCIPRSRPPVIAS